MAKAAVAAAMHDPIKYGTALQPSLNAQQAFENVAKGVTSELNTIQATQRMLSPFYTALLIAFIVACGTLAILSLSGASFVSREEQKGHYTVKQISWAKLFTVTGVSAGAGFAGTLLLHMFGSGTLRFSLFV